MKLTQQRLRQLILESLGLSKILFVFDFDDTLALTDSVVQLVRRGKKYILDSHDFAKYAYQPGDQLDFSDFGRVNGQLIPRTMEILSDALEKGQDVVVITARPPEAAPGIQEFFLQNGMQPPPIYTTSGSANKIPVLERILTDGNYHRVIVYEDCMHNIDSLKQVADNLGIPYHAMCILSDTQMKKIYESRKSRVRDRYGLTRQS